MRVRRLVHVVIAVVTVLLASSVSAVPSDATATFVLLQMNLCNSGVASAPCYAFGRAVDEAATKIHRHRPDLVALQEVCRDDVLLGNGRGKLARAMGDLYGSEHVSVTFAAAFNRITNDWYRCLNGELFGVAVVHRYPGGDPHYGLYRNQDASEEMRTWLCTTVIQERLTGCTTHLSIDPTIALRQCRELMSILDSSWVMPRVVVSGDFNLRSENVEQCRRTHYDGRSDVALQHVLFSHSVYWVRGRHETMRWTDHPMLYEEFRV